MPTGAIQFKDDWPGLFLRLARHALGHLQQGREGSVGFELVPIGGAGVVVLHIVRMAVLNDIVTRGSVIIRAG